jgi:hypothetical protein
VVITGDRRLDLAVRLHYAGVDAEVVSDPLGAVDRALEVASARSHLDVVGNYTAFADLRDRL